MSLSLCAMVEGSVYHIFKLHCVLEGTHDPLKTSVAARFACSTCYLWTIYCVCDCTLESLPGIIWKPWNLPAGKFTAKQLYCWNSDKSTPVYDFESRARCEQLNILYNVAWPPGGCNIESVYFDWHFSFFFSSRHYCCKWCICSIWICSSKKMFRYLGKHLNKFFCYDDDDFWKQSSKNATDRQHNEQKQADLHYIGTPDYVEVGFAELFSNIK